MAASLAILARRGSSSTRCHLPGLGLGLGLDTLRCGRVRPLSMQHADPLRISSICNLGDGRKARLPPRTAVQPPAPHRSCTAVFAQPDRNRRYINIPSTSSSSSSSSSPSAIDATLPAAPAASPSISPAPSWLDRLPTSLRWTRPYFELSRLDKPIGSWLLYWPCAWSITMAAYSCSFPLSSTLFQIVLFGTGAVVMRGAGCTINDLWDRDIDNKVDRTKLRPLAARTVTPKQAIAFLGLQLSVGLAVLTQLNWYSIFLGAASLGVVVVYPLMKRITYWPQFVLGLAFNWGALLGSSAVLGYTNWAVALPLYIGSIGWTLVYDTIYAHQDKKDDVLVDVRSTALLFGENTRPILAGFSASFVSLLAIAGYMNDQTLPFYLISVGGAALHLAWQLRGLKIDDRADCWMRFCSNRDLGFIVWSGIMLDYLIRMFVW